MNPKLYIFLDDQGEMLGQIVEINLERAIKQLNNPGINFDTQCYSTELTIEQ